MKSLSSKGLVFAMGAFALVGSLFAQTEATHIMLDLSQAQVNSRMVMRVRVFPHERDYKPHGMDKVRNQLLIEADKPCALFSAANDRTAAQGKVLKRGLSFLFEAAELKGTARLLTCAEGFRIRRGNQEPQQALSYPGRLYVRLADNGKDLEAINLVSLDEYLKGVVPSEVYREWPMEALKTQAVAARTYAVYHMLHAQRFSSSRLWDVDDTIQFQAYTGSSLRSPRTDAAVQATDSQILTYQGQVIQAFYHADSGGFTEEATAVWNRPIPFTISRPEVVGVKMKRNIWERSISLEALNRELHETGVLKENQQLKQLAVPLAGRTPSGRVRFLTAYDQKGRAVTFPLNLLRRLVGNLPSQLFEVQVQSKTLIELQGIGNGHGIGMSQMGAAALAGSKTWNYQSILAYYYIKTTLCSLDESLGNGLPNCSEDSSRYAEARRAVLGPAG